MVETRYGTLYQSLWDMDFIIVFSYQYTRINAITNAAPENCYPEEVLIDLIEIRQVEIDEGTDEPTNVPKQFHKHIQDNISLQSFVEATHEY